MTPPWTKCIAEVCARYSQHVDVMDEIHTHKDEDYLSNMYKRNEVIFW